MDLHQTSSADQFLLQLRTACYAAAREFHHAQGVYAKVAKSHGYYHDPEVKQALGECLKAAEVYHRALENLFNGLCAAGPLSGSDEEIDRTMRMMDTLVFERQLISHLLSLMK